MPKKVRFTPRPGDLEAAEDALWALGAQSVTLVDAGDEPLHEPGPGETPLWTRSGIEALLPDEADDLQVLLALSAEGLIATPGDVRFEPLPDRDWARAWMDAFEPMRFGRSIWICPTHIEPGPDWETVIRLDPGLAFGSGTHPTTALCLEWMDGIEFDGRSVIDYGCGSGVLAVAAALKGAGRVAAVDHDPQALTATADNAARNSVGDRIHTALPDQLTAAPADIVLANILSGTLVDLAESLCARVAPGGRLVLSGILAEQAEHVEAAYRPLIGEAGTATREGWVRLDFCRK